MSNLSSNINATLGGIGRRSTFVFLSVAVLVALLLTGCEKPEFLDAELPNDGPPIATSFAAARRFAEKLANAGEAATETKRLSLTVSQEEVTSFLSIGSQMSEQLEDLNITSFEQLQQMEGSPQLQDIEGLPEWIDLVQLREGLPELSLRLGIRDPEVYFTANGQIIVRGYATALGQRQPLRLVFAPRASDGELVLDFVEGTLGPVEVPEVLIDQIGLGLAKLILAGDEFVEVTEISVADGSLVVRGAYIQ